MDPLGEHPGHQGERPAAAGEAQQRLEEGVRGAGGVPAFPAGGPLLENEDGGRRHAEPEPEPEPESQPESQPEPEPAAAAGERGQDGAAGAHGRSRVQHLFHQQRAGPTGERRHWGDCSEAVALWQTHRAGSGASLSKTDDRAS